MKVTIGYTSYRTIEAEIDDKYKLLLEDDYEDLLEEIMDDTLDIVNKLGKPGDDNSVEAIIYKDEFGSEYGLIEL